MSGEPTPSFAMQLGSTAVALVLVLLLAWLMLRALKRWQDKTGVGGGAHPVQVLHSVSLGPRERLVTVRWRGREFLLGVGAGAVHRIAEAEVDSPAVEQARPNRCATRAEAASDAASDADAVVHPSYGTHELTPSSLLA